MIDAVVGSIIMMAASLSLVLAIEIAERSVNSASAQPLSLAEQVWLKGELNLSLFLIDIRDCFYSTSIKFKLR